jgi:hypothetical protein
MTMKPLLPYIILLLAFIAGCGTADDGFLFDGEYAADRSRFILRILSKGYLPQEGGPAGEAYAIAQLCPSGTAEGRPVRMTFTALKDGHAMIECGLLGPVAMDWSVVNSEGLLRGVLTASGFRQIDPEELAGCIAAIGRALGAGRQSDGERPGGVPRTVREEFTEGHDIDHDKLPVEWVSPSEVEACK